MSKIASIVQYRDFILIFMENGDIYKMMFDMDCVTFTYILLGSFNPK